MEGAVEDTAEAARKQQRDNWGEPSADAGGQQSAAFSQRELRLRPPRGQGTAQGLPHDFALTTTALHFMSTL